MDDILNRPIVLVLNRNWQAKEVNSRKADRLPEEVGLRLLKRPAAPRELPSTLFIRNVQSIPEWKHFLVE